MNVQTALSVHEALVLNLLRARAWRWSTFDELARLRGTTPRRTLRHHVTRFVQAGLVTHQYELVPDTGTSLRDFLRWNVDAEDALMATYEELGVLVPVVTDPPTSCERCSRVYTDDDRYFDGRLLCARCGVLR